MSEPGSVVSNESLIQVKKNSLIVPLASKTEPNLQAE